MRWLGIAFLGSSLLAGVTRAEVGSWPQFRGPNAAGLAVGKEPLPIKIGPEQNVRWKTALPPGHSSPVVHGDRIYVTAVRDKQLLTIALERRTGSILWEKDAPYQTLEKIHQIGSFAQSSTATDGERVVSFFGSAGLFCYDRDGKLLWQLPMGPFKNDFGAGSSPLLVGDKVLLGQDHDESSFLMALDKRTGKVLWKTDRSEFPRSYATPVLWQVNGKTQVVVVGTLRVAGYDLDTGKEIWTVRGMSRIANMTPVVGADNLLYLAAWAPGGDEGERISLDPVDDYLTRHDANKNGMLELNELPADGPLKQRFTQIDRDKDGHISRTEYENMRRVFEESQNRLVAIKPGGVGDVTATHVAWSQRKQLPYIPSPLYLDGYVYLVKNGGLVSCIEAKTGKILTTERIPGPGNYYSSPVAGDGKIYLLSERGDLSVISTGPDWKVLHRVKFGEDAYATPALVDGCIYLRTSKHLYCFAETK